MNNSKILDFLTVAAEYCACVEQVAKSQKKDFIETAHKIVCLLYLKASLLPVNEDIDGFCEQFVTEDDWNFIQSSVAQKLGDHDIFITIQEPDTYESGETISVNLSECFADIYQDIRDCIERYRIGNAEMQELAIYDCVLHFKIYWGQRALALVSEMHNLLYSPHIVLTNDE